MYIVLYNSLSRCKEKFAPLDEKNVKMYVCGPTVYDRAHLGNARSAVTYDVLFRLLKYYYTNVTYVRNITDVDDKIIQSCIANNISATDLTGKMYAFYKADMRALNCLEPTYEPRATDHISDMIVIIKALIEKGYAYISAGNVLFDVSKFNHYGALSGRDIGDMICSEFTNYKKNHADFVLWKPYVEGEESFCFNSPWGLGRPGWHIECSAMSNAFLGGDFDIHGGGADLMFPHHENEIAQSRCFQEGSSFARYWVHNGFLMVDGQKMSKSLGNFKTVTQYLEGGISGCVIRYVYMGTHYKKPLDFSAKSLDDAKKAMQKFSAIYKKFEFIDVSHLYEEFLHILSDDLNTPIVLAAMHKYANSFLNSGVQEDGYKVVAAMQVLGLDSLNVEDLDDIKIPDEILAMLELRNQAKIEKRWAAADEIRENIRILGFDVIDEKNESFAVKIK